MPAESPLQRLADYDHRAARQVVDLSAQDERRVAYWRAVSFRVAETGLLVDENDVFELLNMPAMTTIPGTKRWVAGIANVRGELLPIIDFGDFLFGRETRPGKHVRVLVIQYTDLRSGLIVDQIYGMRSFPAHQRMAVTDDAAVAAAAPLRAVISGSFTDNDDGQAGRVLHVVEVEKLVNDTEFMRAAA